MQTPAPPAAPAPGGTTAPPAASGSAVAPPAAAGSEPIPAGDVKTPATPSGTVQSGTAPSGTQAEPGSTGTPSAGTTPPQTPSGASASTAASRAAGNGHAGGTPLEATWAAGPDGPSPLLGWGMGLVALSLASGVVVFRMRSLRKIPPLAP